MFVVPLKLTLFRFVYMPDEQKVSVSSPGANHEGGARGLVQAIKLYVRLPAPHQFFVDNFNRSIRARYTATVPDGVVGIFLRQPILDALKREHGFVCLMQDVAVFELAASESLDSVVGSVRLILSSINVQLCS